MAIYYSSCMGVDKVGAHVSSARKSATTLSAALQALATDPSLGCVGDPGVLSMQVIRTHAVAHNKLPEHVFRPPAFVMYRVIVSVYVCMCLFLRSTAACLTGSPSPCLFCKRTRQPTHSPPLPPPLPLPLSVPPAAPPTCRRLSLFLSLSLQADVAGALGQLSSVQSRMVCAPLQDLWLQVVNTCVCTDLFTGFYTMWTSQLVTSLFLFLGVMLAAISWQYFDLPVMGYAIFVPAGSLAKVQLRLRLRVHRYCIRGRWLSERAGRESTVILTRSAVRHGYGLTLLETALSYIVLRCAVLCCALGGGRRGEQGRRSQGRGRGRDGDDGHERLLGAGTVIRLRVASACTVSCIAVL